MAAKFPIFTFPQSRHFSDYGFDSEIDYFQVLEEKRKHKREATSRSIDSLRFKLQKPISKDGNSKKKKRWWRSAFRFFNRRRWSRLHPRANSHPDTLAFRTSISGPVETTESWSGSSTHYQLSARHSSGSLAGILTPTRKSEVNIPYMSLREVNMDHQQKLPIYMVT